MDDDFHCRFFDLQEECSDQKDANASQKNRAINELYAYKEAFEKLNNVYHLNIQPALNTQETMHSDPLRSHRGLYIFSKPAGGYLFIRVQIKLNLYSIYFEFNL